MVYYSHSESLPDETKRGTKLLRDHTKGVSEKALISFEKSTTLDFDIGYLKSLISDVCQYHDLGKYTSYFQQYLLTNETINLHLKQHARFGAYSIFEKYKENDNATAVFLYFIISVTLKVQNSLEKLTLRTIKKFLKNKRQIF
jgi:CRISPR-associated endonuclease/helicase Cas3